MQYSWHVIGYLMWSASHLIVSTLAKKKNSNVSTRLPAPMGPYIMTDPGGVFEFQMVFEKDYATFEFLFHYNESGPGFKAVMYSATPKIPISYNSESGNVSFSIQNGSVTADILKKTSNQLYQFFSHIEPSLKTCEDPFELPTIEWVKWSANGKELHLHGLLVPTFQLEKIDQSRNLLSEFQEYVGSDEPGSLITPETLASANATGTSCGSKCPSGKTPGAISADSNNATLSTNSTNASSGAVSIIPLTSALAVLIFSILQ